MLEGKGSKLNGRGPRQSAVVALPGGGTEAAASESLRGRILTVDLVAACPVPFSNTTARREEGRGNWKKKEEVPLCFPIPSFLIPPPYWF